jgi:hypothetical protein
VVYNLTVVMKFQLLLLSIFLTGCAANRPQVVMFFTHPPIYPQGYIPIKVGVQKFKDLRPEKEKKPTKEIKDFEEELTALITKDLREAELFENIRINYNPQDIDLILTGEINSFYWKSFISPTTKLPYVKYIHDIGLATGEGEGEVTITFILINPQTMDEIARYKESVKMKRSYKKNELRSSGNETAEALRKVLKQFITHILKDKEKILDALPEYCNCNK